MQGKQFRLQLYTLQACSNIFNSKIWLYGSPQTHLPKTAGVTVLRVNHSHTHPHLHTSFHMRLEAPQASGPHSNDMASNWVGFRTNNDYYSVVVVGIIVPRLWPIYGSGSGAVGRVDSLNELTIFRVAVCNANNPEAPVVRSPVCIPLRSLSVYVVTLNNCIDVCTLPRPGEILVEEGQEERLWFKLSYLTFSERKILRALGECCKFWLNCGCNVIVVGRPPRVALG